MRTRVFLLLFVGFLLPGCRTDPQASSPSPFASGPEGPVGASAPAPDVPRPAAPSHTPSALFVEFVATPPDVVERMLKLARVEKNDVVYDLGCGDGRIVVAAAQRCGCRAIGYDLDPLRVREARRNAVQHQVSHLVTVEQKDILHADLHEASVVTLYLSPEINARLIPQLRTLRPGSRIVSHDFPVGDLVPDEIVTMTSRVDRRKHMLYLWTCPLAPNGRGRN